MVTYEQNLEDAVRQRMSSNKQSMLSNVEDSSIFGEKTHYEQSINYELNAFLEVMRYWKKNGSADEKIIRYAYNIKNNIITLLKPYVDPSFSDELLRVKDEIYKKYKNPDERIYYYLHGSVALCLDYLNKKNMLLTQIFPDISSDKIMNAIRAEMVLKNRLPKKNSKKIKNKLAKETEEIPIIQDVQENRNG